MRIPGWLFALGIVLFVGMTGLLAVLAFSVARQVAIDAPWQVGPPSFEQAMQATPSATHVPQLTPTLASTAAPGETTAPTAPPQPTQTLDPSAAIADWPPGKFTVLLLGIDQRKAVEDGGPYYRTDTMMVVSVDSVRKTAGILSIPRALWVNIPGFQSGRINTANSLGDANGYPGGGPALAAETVRQTLGIPVNKYILINFDVFTTLVNTIAPDGTEICVQQAIDDDHYPDAGNGVIHVHF